MKAEDRVETVAQVTVGTDMETIIDVPVGTLGVVERVDRGVAFVWFDNEPFTLIGVSTKKLRVHYEG